MRALLHTIGCAVDYSMAARTKAKLQSAADAGSVARIAAGLLDAYDIGQVGGELEGSLIERLH
jgi:hypothetical protein